MSTEHAGRKRLRDWLWLVVKVVASAAVLAICAGWLKNNVAPTVRWFIYPAFFLIFLAVAVPLVFGVRPKLPWRKSGSDR